MMTIKIPITQSVVFHFCIATNSSDGKEAQHSPPLFYSLETTKVSSDSSALKDRINDIIDAALVIYLHLSSCVINILSLSLRNLSQGLEKLANGRFL